MRLAHTIQIAALAGFIGSLPAQAVELPPAIATIDWSTLQIQVIDTDPLDGITPLLTFSSRSSSVSSQAPDYDQSGSADWITDLVSSSGVASASVGTGGLIASFAAVPSTLNAFAQASRYGSFVVTANTLVTFQVAASASVQLPVPLNGSAYAWARFEANGPGFFGDLENQQRSGTEKLVFAEGSGVPLFQGGLLYASFYNGTSAEMEGQLSGFSQVNSYGFIPVVPEPQSVAMMLAGVGLLAAVARRRRRD